MRHSLRLALILSTILCAQVAFSQTDAFLWTATGGMQDLGVMAGWQYSGGYGINQAGVIVGEVTKVQGEGYVNAAIGWQAGIGMHYIPGLSKDNSSATAVNDRGQVVGQATTASGEIHAFLWTRDGGAQDLGTLGGSTSYASAINNSGQVIGSSETATGMNHAFLWTQESGMQDLMSLTHRACSGCESIANAINDSGVIVGQLGHHQGGRLDAFVWKNGHGKSLGDLGGTGMAGSSANGVNKSGQVVGVAETPDGASHAFLWTESGGMQDLGTLPGGSDSQAYAINNQGQVVGESDLADGNYHAFIWDSVGGMQDLGTLGGPSSVAAAINDSGEVTGVADLP
ncbi:MAG TPA: DUF3466 family protein [Terriglobales bacterium]|jgi:probable HAF family extracellular repeat protein|nr:DUF3466 family protein [Terriglobales bacterium]